MTLNIDDYVVHYEPLKRIADRKEPHERMDLIGLYSATNQCPIIVSAVFIGRMYGFDEELRAFILRQMHFYRLKPEELKGYTV